MSRSNHTEGQMIATVKRMEPGRKVEDVAREYGVSKHTIHAWEAKYGGMDVTEAQEAKRLRDENARLRKRSRLSARNGKTLPQPISQSIPNSRSWSRVGCTEEG